MPTMLLDARNLRCPMPLLKLKQALHSLPPGESLTVLTTDPGSLRDFEAFLRQAGHDLLSVEHGEREFRFEVRKKC